jgi:hypothetical protein
VDLTTALLRDLLDLSASIDGHGELGARLTALITALRAAVPSYRGLYLTVHDNGQPLTLTSFLPTADGDITTSMRLPFTALAPGFDLQSRVIFYATTPGAFVDLAADLAHALHTPTVLAAQGPDRTGRPDARGQSGDSRPGGKQQSDGERAGVIVLDADLPPHTLVSQWTGLHEVSTINRAIGVLIDRGHPPDDAHAALRRHAAAAGVDPHIYAARLLRR